MLPGGTFGQFRPIAGVIYGRLRLVHRQMSLPCRIGHFDVRLAPPEASAGNLPSGSRLGLQEPCEGGEATRGVERVRVRNSWILPTPDCWPQEGGKIWPTKSKVACWKFAVARRFVPVLSTKCRMVGFARSLSHGISTKAMSTVSTSLAGHSPQWPGFPANRGTVAGVPPYFWMMAPRTHSKKRC